MYGHVIYVPTHFNVKLPAIGGHLPNADADIHLLVVCTCYNGQCKQMPHFRWSYEPKIARGTHPKLRPTISSNFHAVIWIFISRANACVRNHVIVASQRVVRPFGYIRFTLRRKSHVFCVKPAMSKKRTILSFDQCASCTAIAIELVRQNANSTYRSRVATRAIVAE